MVTVGVEELDEEVVVASSDGLLYVLGPAPSIATGGGRGSA